MMSGLMVLKERIDATEALIAIDLDNRRNELVAFDLVSGCQACRVQALGRAANDIVLQAAAVLSHSVGKGGGGQGGKPFSHMGLMPLKGNQRGFGRGRGSLAVTQA